MPIAPPSLDLDTAIATLATQFYWGAGNITYSIPVAGSSWTGYDAGSEPFNASYAVASSAVAAQFRLAIQRWDELIARSFVEVAEPGSIGNIRVAFTDVEAFSPGAWGYASFPPFQGGSASARNGDIWIASTTAAESFAVGSFNFQATMHEIGHALGLEHPFEAIPALAPQYDNYRYSIMSYTAQTDLYNARFVSTGGGGIQTSFAPVYFSGPSIYDIAAIQSVYGVDTTTRSGDTSYTWNPATPSMEVIYDAGGTDTFDLSGATRPSYLDLRSGAYSTVHFYSKAAQIEAAVASFGEVFRAFITTSVNSNDTFAWENNVGIAFSTTIENALLGEADDSAIGNEARNQLDGNGGADTLFGMGGNDTLNGGNGNDILDGGSGADVMYGGQGDDQYYLDDAGDIVNEIASEGTENAWFRANGMTLPANVEIGRLIDLAVLLIGGIASNDILVTNPAGGSTLFGQGGSDELWGSSHADTLNGGDGDDVLRSQGGADNLHGGIGNDHFVIQNASAVIFEDVGGGSDTAWVAVNDYTLAANIEVARLAAAGAVRIFGSGGSEDIVANQGEASTIDGQGGNDTLWGSPLADVLNGNVGNDILRSQGGADQLHGGDGDDAFVVFDAGAVITEGNGASSGYDTAWIALAASANYVVGANVERINLAGSANIVTGNEQDNLIVGNPTAGSTLNGAGGADTIFGSGFADVFFGGTGDDIFYSQGGADIFRYTSVGFGFDQISGFVQGQAVIHFSGMGLSFADLSFQTANGNTQVTVGGDRILIYGAVSLTQSDFMF